MAAPRRTGGAQPEVVGGDTAAGRRAARRAQGPDVTTDTDRDQAYRQGQAAAQRALEERPRFSRTKGPAQVHSDPELQGYYEQGHHDTVHDARRRAVSGAVAGPASSARSVGDNGAGFVFGLLAFALFRNYLTGGWSGVQQWLAAKFVNKTSGASSSTPALPNGPTPPPITSPIHAPNLPPGLGATGQPLP